MEQFVIILVIFSALLHVYWNGLLKRGYDKHVFTWWLLFFSLLLFLPLALKFFELSPEGLRFALLSGVIHAAYFLSLGYAYEEGELSLVYPIARSAPAIVPFLAYFILGEIVPLKGYLGISLVVLGIFMLNLHEISALGIENALKIFRMKPAIIAMITAWITSFYSIVDKLGVSVMNPIFYIYLMFLFSFLGVSIFVIMKKRALILCELMMNGRFVFISGALCMLSYLLILYAMRLTYLSYVIALRQVGVILSLLIAVILLRERIGKWRVFASVMIFLGLLIISN